MPFYEINNELIWFELLEPSGAIAGVEVSPAKLYGIEGYSETHALLSIDDFDEILSAAVGDEGLGQYLGHDGLSNHEAGRTIKTWVYSEGVVRVELRKEEDSTLGIESFRVFFFRNLETKPEGCHLVDTTIPKNIIAKLSINNHDYISLSSSYNCEIIGTSNLLSAAGPLDIAYPGPSSFAKTNE